MMDKEEVARKKVGLVLLLIFFGAFWGTYFGVLFYQYFTK